MRPEDTEGFGPVGTNSKPSLVAEVRARLAAATAGEWRARVAAWPSSPAWVVEVELPCINGLRAWFPLANLFTPERREEAWTEGAIDRESARANAELMAASKADLAALCDRVETLEAALEWYAEQTRLCRLLTGDGDAGRDALSADGGKRARALLHHR